MLDYRFDFFDVDGQLVAVERLKARDDAAALQAARSFSSMHALEIWQNARRVMVLNGMSGK